MVTKMKALIEFDKLQENEVFTIVKIKNWLFKYVGSYQDLNLNWNCSNAGCSYRRTKQCSCNKKEDAYIFLSLFDTLMGFSRYHQKENYAELELESYSKIKHDKELVKKWVIKNEYVGTKDCFELVLRHYDYDLKPLHLLVTGKSLLGYEVFVDREDFKSIIKFLDIFNDLFWVKKVWPESEVFN